jgi:hypothetical protein
MGDCATGGGDACGEGIGHGFALLGLFLPFGLAQLLFAGFVFLPAIVLVRRRRVHVVVVLLIHVVALELLLVRRLFPLFAPLFLLG